MKDYKASLIIPIHNEKNLEIIFKSINNQQKINQGDLEIVIVNDGGTKVNRTLLQLLIFPVLYIELDTNRGRSAARNCGARWANAPLLIFSDGDRFLGPEFIASHICAHDMNKLGDSVVIGDIAEVYTKDMKMIDSELSNMFYDNNSILWKFIYRNNYANIVFSIYNEEGRVEFGLPWITLLSGNFSISKDLYWKTQGFDEAFKKWGYENIDFGYRLFQEGISFFYEKRAVNFHIFHKQNREIYNSGTEYIYQKYNCHSIWLSYFMFLDGKISFGEMNEYKSIDDIYYNKNRVGPRYFYK